MRVRSGSLGIAKMLRRLLLQNEERKILAFQTGRSPCWRPRDHTETSREIETIERDMVGMETRTRKERLFQLQRAYEIAYVLRQDQDSYLDWCRSFPASDRKRPNYTKPELALHYVLGLIMRSGDPDIRARLSKMRTAFAYPFEQMVHPSRILDFIRKSGGTDQMTRAQRARQRAAKEGKEFVDKPAVRKDTITIRIPADVRASRLLAGAGRNFDVRLTVVEAREKSAQLALKRVVRLKERATRPPL